MSPGEALMWNVEKDPWLNPSAASVSIVDGELDIEVVRRWLAAMVADVPRLRDRVRHGVGRFTTPTWVPDPEFDFDYHIRHVDLPEPGTERQLLDLIALLHREPYDRTRPPWQVIVIGGLEGGRGALVMKLHHTIADGYGMARLQARFMVRDPDLPPPEPVDLDAIVAATCAEAEAQRVDAAANPIERAARVVTGPAELSWRLSSRLGRLATDPGQLGSLASSTRGLARMAVSQLRPGGTPGRPAPGHPAPRPTATPTRPARRHRRGRRARRCGRAARPAATSNCWTSPSTTP